MPRPSRPRPVAGQRARARTHGGTAPPAELPGRRTAVIERPPAAAGDVERVPAPEPRDPRRTAARAAWSGDWLGGSGRARAALAALLVLALVALVALGLVALRVRAADRVELARDQAQAAANAQVVDILS
ncbi:MAG: hypothetical protein ACXV4A_02770, partial [Actinomycetes bacterium]